MNSVTKLKKIEIAVILVNYNSTAYTIQAIKSIQEKTKPGLDFHIVVVDNNSKTHELQKLKNFKDQNVVHNFTLVESRINLGFSGGNMLGVQNIVAKYYFFLNNDCLLLTDCLNILYDFCEKHPKVALCTGLMFNEKMEVSINYQYHPTPKLKWLGVGCIKIFQPRKICI